MLDRNATLKRMGGDENLYQDMIRFYLEDTPPLLQVLRDSLQAGNGDEAARAAHSLKGLSSNFGAADIQQTAATLEQACMMAQIDVAQGLLPTLAEQIEVLIAELRREQRV